MREYWITIFRWHLENGWFTYCVCTHIYFAMGKGISDAHHFILFFIFISKKVYYASPIINFKLNFCSLIECMVNGECVGYVALCFSFFMCFFFVLLRSLVCSIIGHRHQFIWIPKLKKAISHQFCIPTNDFIIVRKLKHN